MKKTLAAFVILSALVASTAQAQTAYPRSCMALYRAGQFTGDGEYTIQPRDVAIQVYCHALHPDGWPVDFITLKNTGGDFNFGMHAAGGGVSGTDVRTSYTKVRFDPSTMMIDIADMTFASSSGTVYYGTSPVTTMPLGVAMDCAYPGSSTGVGNIDLTGTGYEIDDVFFTQGYAPAGSVTFNGVTIPLPATEDLVEVKRTAAVTIHGGGHCGAAGVDGFNSSLFFWTNNKASMPALKVKWVGLPVP